MRDPLVVAKENLKTIAPGTEFYRGLANSTEPDLTKRFRYFALSKRIAGVYGGRYKEGATIYTFKVTSPIKVIYITEGNEEEYRSVLESATLYGQWLKNFNVVWSCDRKHPFIWISRLKKMARNSCYAADAHWGGNLCEALSPGGEWASLGAVGYYSERLPFYSQLDITIHGELFLCDPSRWVEVASKEDYLPNQTKEEKKDTGWFDWIR